MQKTFFLCITALFLSVPAAYACQQEPGKTVLEPQAHVFVYKKYQQEEKRRRDSEFKREKSFRGYKQNMSAEQHKNKYDTAVFFRQQEQRRNFVKASIKKNIVQNNVRPSSPAPDTDDRSSSPSLNAES